jgi:aminoglycoside phosphotransferase (APT) family kinase protein
LTVPDAAPPGVDLDALATWAATALPEVVAPLSGSLIAGGRSNITVRVTDATGSQYVVRRPPLHSVLPTAHDVGREHRVIHALGPTAVPVPRALAMCTDADVLGAPFYVMDFVEGIVLNDVATAIADLDVAGRGRAGESLVDALVALHDVDVDAVGLGDFAKKDDFIARQLRRWHRQWEQTHHRDVVTVDRVHDILAAQIPEQRESRIVHGDFRLGNCIVGPDGELRAVLDWELCTLGDPLADVGYVLATWSRPDDDRAADTNFPSLAPGFAERDDLIARYVDLSGRDLDQIDFYVAFSFWRLACILEGVYVRAVAGAQGGSDVDPAVFRDRVDNCALLAEEHAARLAARS